MSYGRKTCPFPPSVCSPLVCCLYAQEVARRMPLTITNLITHVTYDPEWLETPYKVCSVSVPPDIVYDDTSGDLAVAEGENATLWCKATGHPTPRITWRREDGGPIIIRKGTRDAIRGRLQTSWTNEAVDVLNHSQNSPCTISAGGHCARTTMAV